ncbi:hypothetical protein BH09ACT8_BH09ACT8_30940 [soil metagenome]
MTGREVVKASTPDLFNTKDAREVTNRIQKGLGTLADLIGRAYLGRVWLALGYQSWDDYLDTEFTSGVLAVPREERPEAVKSLREQGLSLRAIAAATGVSEATVRNDIGEQVRNNCAPDDDEVADAAPVVGLDGKGYKAPPPRPKPRTLTPAERFRKLVVAVYDHTEPLTALDGYSGYREDLRAINSGDLEAARNRIQATIDWLWNDDAVEEFP